MKKCISGCWGLIGIGSMIVMAMLPLPGFSAEGGPFYTLAESIDKAVTDSPSIRAKQEAIAMARYSELQSKADLLPTLSTSYEYTHESEKDYLWPGFPVSTNENYEWRATIEQPLFKGFSLTNQVKLAGVKLELAKIELEIEKHDIALKVKIAYFNVLKADRNVDVAAQALDSIREHVDVARSFLGVGKITEQDLMEAEVRYADAQEDWIHAQNAAQLARATFSLLVSQPIETLFEIEDILTFEPLLPCKIDDYVRRALNRRLELKAIDLNLRAVGLGKKINQSAYYPNISVRADYIREGDGPEVNGSDFHKDEYWNASATLTWNFWQWGKVSYRIREKQSFQKQIKQTRVTEINRITLEIKETVLLLEHAEMKIPITIKALKLAEENLRIQRKRYEMQISTSSEFIDAQYLLSEAQAHYYNALYDHNLAKAKLIRALGDY